MAATRLADELARTAVAEMGDGAGVDDVDIGNFVEVALYEACAAHLLANSFAIGLVDFAAEGRDGECCCWLRLVVHIFLVSGAAGRSCDAVLAR